MRGQELIPSTRAPWIFLLRIVYAWDGKTLMPAKKVEVSCATYTCCREFLTRRKLRAVCCVDRGAVIAGNGRVIPVTVRDALECEGVRDIRHCLRYLSTSNKKFDVNFDLGCDSVFKSGAQITDKH
jgi:hypothetical protein